MTIETHVYEALLGRSWQDLPDVTRMLHSPDPVVRFRGEADIRRGHRRAATLIADMLGLPEAGQAIAADVRVSAAPDGQEWLERWYDGRRFATLQYGRAGLLHERFGPFTLMFKLEGSVNGITFRRRGVRLWGVPLPSVLAPRITATERADGDCHLFDVELKLPLIGRIIAYRGRLKPLPD